MEPYSPNLREGQLHLVAYSIRSLSPLEHNNSVTELEKFYVVWAATHFHAYLYKHSVTINTDTALNTWNAKSVRQARKVVDKGLQVGNRQSENCVV